ncbi:Brix domain-containing protein [Lactifluus subvellereus]|nr:Brix domain-containing protein [Lactifluus subvellereus]
MARRRKNRTHLKGTQSSATSSANAPKSFVIKHGHVGTSLTQLTRDIRKVMEPNTASRLKERSRNKLKDFLTMAPALQVTHLLAFTLTGIAPSLRIVRLSNGPTLSFRVERYSLVKDVIASSRHAKYLSSIESMSAPLVHISPSLPRPGVLPPAGPFYPSAPHARDENVPDALPPLAPHKLALSSARRVVLVSYNAERGTVNVRHFRIAVKPYSVSRRVRRVLQGATTTTTTGATSATTTTSATRGAVLDLGNERDVADYVLRGAGAGGASVDGYESAVSEAASLLSSSVAAAEEDEADVVSLAEDDVGRNNRGGQKRAVRLDEIGPRMELRLVKITEGVPGKEGAVIYHEFVKKTKAEAAAQKASHAAREKLRKQRREEQERNDDDGSSDAPGEEEEGGEGSWDEDEEISEGEVSEDDDARSEEDPSSEDEDELQEKPPKKRRK